MSFNTNCPKKLCNYSNRQFNFCTYLSLLISFLTGVLFTYFYLETSLLSFSTKGFSVVLKSKLINPSVNVHPSSFDRCGIWQKTYIDRHRAILNGSLPPRYFVSLATESGLADRLSGTLTAFVFALLTDRAFQITPYGTLPQFEAAFLSPNINWSRPTDPDNLIDNLQYTYLGFRGYTGDRSYGPDVNTSLYWPVYLMNDEEGNAFFLLANVSKYPLDHENVMTVFVASNYGRVSRLFDNPYHRSQLFQMGLRPETATKCIFDFLFAPTDAVRTVMSREFAALQSTDILKIAINIRVGDSVFDPEYDAKTTLSPYEPFFICASNIEFFARVPHQRVIWYVTSDSLRILQLAKERYGEKVLTDDQTRYVHGDCGDSKAKRYGNCTKASQDFSIRMAAGQIWAMSMCDYHVVSAMSGFGRFATLLANHWHSVYQIHLRNRTCNQAGYDTLEVVTTVGSGI